MFDSIESVRPAMNFFFAYEAWTIMLYILVGYSVWWFFFVIFDHLWR